MIKRGWIGLLAMALGGAAIAGQTELYVAKSSGTLTIRPDGTVADVTMARNFGEPLNAKLKERFMAWTFEPVIEDGRAITALAHMQFSLQAEIDADDDELGKLSIVQADFVDPPKLDADKHPRGKRPSRAMVPPRYPTRPLSHRLGADVLLTVELDDEGRAKRAAPSVTWLYGTPGWGLSASKAMDEFVAVSIKAAMQWSYPKPVDIDSRYVSVPITFLIDNTVWHRATIVEQTPPDWVIERDAERVALDAGGRPTRNDIRLLSALDQATL